MRTKKITLFFLVLSIASLVTITSFAAKRVLNYDKKSPGLETIGEDVYSVLDNNINTKKTKKVKSVGSITNNYVGEFKNTKADKSKSKIIKNKKNEMKYYKSQNIKKTPLEKRSDSYGSYDIYTDSSNTEYCFLANTDKLCGMKLEEVYGVSSDKEKISEDLAIVKANEYLTGIIDNLEEYELDKVTYKNRESIYEVKYIYKVSGVKTDDAIVVWVMNDGTIGAFNAFYRDRYAKISPKYNASSLRGKTISEANEEVRKTKKIKESQTKVTDEYITIDDSGNLSMAYEMAFTVDNSDNSTEDEIYVDTFLKAIE